MQRLLSEMEGEEGLISSLQRLHDNHLLPVSNRLPVDGVIIDDGDLGTNAEKAAQAEQQVCLMVFLVRIEC